MNSCKREIKFRQWIGKGRGWHYFGFKDGICSGVAEVCIDTYPIYQYTGLKDRNGKEIYEGDNIFWNSCPGMDSGSANVVWYEGGMWYVENDSDDIYTELYNVFDDSVIIGNIHEEKTHE